MHDWVTQVGAGGAFILIALKLLLDWSRKKKNGNGEQQYKEAEQKRHEDNLKKFQDMQKSIDQLTQSLWGPNGRGSGLADNIRLLESSVAKLASEVEILKPLLDVSERLRKFRHDTERDVALIIDALERIHPGITKTWHHD